MTDARMETSRIAIVNFDSAWGTVLLQWPHEGQVMVCDCFVSSCEKLFEIYKASFGPQRNDRR